MAKKIIILVILLLLFVNTPGTNHLGNFLLALFNTTCYFINDCLHAIRRTFVYATIYILVFGWWFNGLVRIERLRLETAERRRARQFRRFMRMQRMRALGLNGLRPLAPFPLYYFEQNWNVALGNDPIRRRQPRGPEGQEQPQQQGPQPQQGAQPEMDNQRPFDWPRRRLWDEQQPFLQDRNGEELARPLLDNNNNEERGDALLNELNRHLQELRVRFPRNMQRPPPPPPQGLQQIVELEEPQQNQNIPAEGQNPQNPQEGRPQNPQEGGGRQNLPNLPGVPTRRAYIRPLGRSQSASP